MSAAIQGIYVALFGRPADPGGLAYWTEVTKNGTDLSEMLRVLPSLPEYTERFAGLSPEQVITNIYLNLFGRTPDDEGKAYFLAQLESGAQTLATIAVNILHGAQGDDKADVDAKIEAAQLFTSSLDTPEEIDAYRGIEAADLAKKFIDTVDKDAPATPESAEAAAGAVVAGEDPTDGGEPNPDPDDGDGDDGEGDGDTGGGNNGGGNNGGGDTGVSREGDVSLVARDGAGLWVGDGNSIGNFNLTTTSVSNIEIGLKGYVRQTNSTPPGEAGDVDQTNGVYKFGAYDAAGFAYSLAALSGSSLKAYLDAGYSFHLKIDNDPGVGFGANSVELTLVEGGTRVKAQDSGYDWVVDAAPANSIKDDEGGAAVTQNIQSPLWYGATSTIGHGDNQGVRAGEYSVSLEVRQHGVTIATEEITLDVAAESYALSAGKILAAVAKSGDNMLNGGGNTADKFQIGHFDLNQDKTPDLEIAIGAAARNVGAVDITLGGDAVFATGAGGANGIGVPTFKFSVASLRDGVTLADVLNQYDIKLLVDNNPTSETNFVELTAVVRADNNGALDWQFGGSHSSHMLTDDAGNAAVSQNIQALGWYQPDSNGELFGPDYNSAAGEYTVSIAVYEKNTTNLIGMNSVDFIVGPTI